VQEGGNAERGGNRPHEQAGVDPDRRLDRRPPSTGEAVLEYERHVGPGQDDDDRDDADECDQVSHLRMYSAIDRLLPGEAGRELNSREGRPTTQPVLHQSSGPPLPSPRVWRDRIALGAAAIAAATLAAVVNVHQRLHSWSDEHPGYDPFLLLPVAVGLAVLTLAYLIVTRRRLRREVGVRQDREEALTRALHKIDVLSGLLAMCAACKRIRGEDDRWEPVEAYLQRHGEISVSHGICPGCTTRLYPDYADALSDRSLQALGGVAAEVTGP
jgi:hypothetical protein